MVTAVTIPQQSQPNGWGESQIRYDHDHEVPLGSPNSDTGTKSLACPHKQRTKVESMGAPGKPKMRTGSKSSACAHETGIRNKSTDAPQKPKVR